MPHKMQSRHPSPTDAGLEEPCRGVARRGVARRGVARRGVAWRGVARRGVARRLPAWPPSAGSLVARPAQGTNLREGHVAEPGLDAADGRPQAAATVFHLVDDRLHVRETRRAAHQNALPQPGSVVAHGPSPLFSALEKVASHDRQTKCLREARPPAQRRSFPCGKSNLRETLAHSRTGSRSSSLPSSRRQTCAR